MVVRLENVTKSYGEAGAKVPVLRGVSLALEAGETLALTGESGSGKSTLLHLAAGLDVADGGTVEVAGQDMSGLDDGGRAALRRRTVGLVFQQFNLIPSLTVEGNIGFQARLSGQAPDTAELAERLGLTDHLAKYPEQLSGGQQQRVAIGRTLAARPKLILADEPTGNLDEATGAAVLDLMLELVAESGAGFLMVTHSVVLAERLSRRIHLSGGLVA